MHDDTKGCAPGWTPDTVLAERAFDSVSIEEQIRRERKRYAAEFVGPPDPTLEVKEPAGEPETEDDDAPGR